MTPIFILGFLIGVMVTALVSLILMHHYDMQKYKL